MIITGLTDLMNYVDSHSGDNITQTDRNTICRKIWYDKNRPDFGKDWSKYLSKLPEHLIELLD